MNDLNVDNFCRRSGINRSIHLKRVILTAFATDLLLKFLIAHTRKRFCICAILFQNESINENKKFP